MNSISKSVLVASSLAIAACSSGGGDSSGTSPTRFEGSGEIANIPALDQRYTEDVISISYDPASDTLTVRGDPFDLAGSFERVPEKDVRGFAAFENQGGARRYTALVRTDTDNGLAAGVVGTPIRLDNQFGGTMLARSQVPQMPSNVEVTHVGDYAGVRNVGGNNGADTSNSFLYRVEGKVRLDLDFFDDRPMGGIEGVITDRRSVDQTVEIDGETRNVTYDDVVLVFSDVDDEGNFQGAANIRGSGAGAYSGIIAGNDAAASAGIITLTENGELERGGFIARTE